MADFSGTVANEQITPTGVSPTVAVLPEGGIPSGDPDIIDGGGGTDTIAGAGGDDTISFSGYGSTAHGGAGDDAVRFDAPVTGGSVLGAAYGDAGTDDVSFHVSTDSDDIECRGSIVLRGGGGDDTLGGWLGLASGSASKPSARLDVSMYGDAGNDKLNASTHLTGSSYMPEEGGKNRDLLYGGGGDDTYRVQERQDVVIEKPGQGYDTVVVNNSSTGSYTLSPNVEQVEVWDWYSDLPCDLTGNDQPNFIRGTAAKNRLNGKGGNDTLYGDAGADLLIGGTGGDAIYGDAGDDTIRGGAGLDRLFGSDGGDRFDYDAVSDSRRGEASRDVIHDYGGVGGSARTDVIDLSTIDANSSAGGNQAFSFRGTRAFSAPGQIRVEDSGWDTLIQANVTGRSGAEMEILVTDGYAPASEWNALDFLL